MAPVMPPGRLTVTQPDDPPVSWRRFKLYFYDGDSLLFVRAPAKLEDNDLATALRVLRREAARRMEAKVAKR